MIFNRHDKLEGLYSFFSVQATITGSTTAKRKLKKPILNGERPKRAPNFTHSLLIASASGRSCPDRSRH